MLDFLERTASAFWGFIQRVVALITPFGRGREFFRMGAGLRAFLHVAVLAAVLGFLWWLNQFPWIHEKILAPSFAPRIRFFWLPILFLLLYAMAWLGWWLWKLLGPEEYVTDFPDIDAAWDEAVQALNEQNIDIVDAPLFLVVGQPAGGEEPMFAAAQLQLSVKQAPRRGDAPLHVYANRDGIYVTCAGASLLARQAALLNGSGEEAAGDPFGGGGEGEGGSDDDKFKTMRMDEAKGAAGEIRAILARAYEEGRGRDQLTDDEKERIRVLLAEEAAQAKGPRKPAASLLKNTAEVELLTARLQHLCRLIVRDRRPYCPLNGILVLVPYAAGDRDEDASATGTIVQQELAAARAALQVHCPVFGVICDVERGPGFREFIERFPTDQRQRRLGQRFPLLPDIEPDTLAAMIEGGVSWVCESLVPNWAYKLFRLEGQGRDDVTAVTRGNSRLYQFMSDMHQRSKRLGRIFVRAATSEQGGPPLFGGCYLAGTGRDAREQAYVAGVFRRLIENQNYVSWTDDALQEEAANQSWVTYGYTGLGVAVLVLVGIGVLLWLKKSA